MKQYGGVKPVNIINEYRDTIELSNAVFVDNQYDGEEGIKCVGSLQRDYTAGISVDDYIRDTEYIGAKVQINDIGKHNYLVFYGKKILDHAQPTVVVFDDSGNKIGEVNASYHDLDTEWHQYLIDLSNIDGNITVYFNGGYVDSTGSQESEYIFSNIVLY